MEVFVNLSHLRCLAWIASSLSVWDSTGGSAFVRLMSREEEVSPEGLSS